MPHGTMRHTDDNNLLSNGKDAAAAAAREKIKAGHDHLQEAAIGELLADGASKSVLELGLKRSTPGLLEAIELRLFGSASKSLFLRRLLALVAEEKAEAGPGLKARMREWAKDMGYGEAWRDYTTAVCDGNEPGDDIALELLVHELHLHVVLHKDDGSVEKEIKCEGTPLAKLHLVRAASTFCTLIVPHHLKGKQAMPADNVPDPPTDWVSPVVGERVEVHVEDDGWCSAEVLAVLPGQFKVQLKVAPNNSDGSVTPPTPLPMDDWLTWEQEGTEWRRTAHASPVTVPASPTRLIDAAGAAMPSIGGGASPSDGGGVVVEGGLKTRPRGRAPAGKVWNSVTGAWVFFEEDPGEVPAQAQAERAQAMAAQPTARSEAGGDGLTDLSPLLETAGALKERMAKPVVPAPADAPVASGAELSLKPPGQLAKMAALFAQCDAVAAEGVAVGAETAALLEAVRAKESALHARMRTLESEEEQKEEELHRLKGLEALLQDEGCNTHDVRAKLGAADSGLEQLQGELHACGQALAVLQTLPEELEQQASDAHDKRAAMAAALSKELQSCAEALPAELERFEARVAPPVAQLRALQEESAAKIKAVRSIHQRPVAELEAEPKRAGEEAAKSLELLRAKIDEAADQLEACSTAVASLDAPARATLHKGLVRAALGTHAAATGPGAQAELARLLTAAAELQAAVKLAGWSLGAVGNYIFGIVGIKRGREW